MRLAPLAPLASLLALAACALRPGTFAPDADMVKVRNTLEALLPALSAAPDERAAGEAWRSYLARDFREEEPDLASAKPESLGKAILAARPRLEAISAAAPAEAREVAVAVGKLHGRSVKVELVVAALTGDAPLGAEPAGGGPVVTLNARAPAAADPLARRALLARAFGASLLPRAGDPVRMLAGTVYLRALSAAGALAVVPGAPRAALTGRSEEETARLRARLPLLARELLAAFDSGSPEQVQRFFGSGAGAGGSKGDPLVPRGAGELLAVELGAALVEDLGSAEQVVRLAPGEFPRHARRALQRLSGP